MVLLGFVMSRVDYGTSSLLIVTVSGYIQTFTCNAKKQNLLLYRTHYGLHAHLAICLEKKSWDRSSVRVSYIIFRIQRSLYCKKNTLWFRIINIFFKSKSVNRQNLFSKVFDTLWFSYFKKRFESEQSAPKKRNI